MARLVKMNLMDKEAGDKKRDSFIDLIVNFINQRSYETVLLLILLAVFCLYPLTNVPHDVVHVLRTAWDDQIPRVPAFSIIYLAFLPWVFLTIIYSWYKKRDFEQLAFSMILVNLAACLVYILFQTYVPREPILSDDIFSKIVGFIYTHDKPYDCFPSLHAAFSALVATHFILRKSKWAWATVIFAFLIVISTLFVKQHFIADAVSGVLLGILMTLLVFYVLKRKNPITLKSKTSKNV